MRRIKLNQARLLGSRVYPKGAVVDVAEDVAAYETAVGSAVAADGDETTETMDPPTGEPEADSPPAVAQTRTLADVAPNADDAQPQSETASAPSGDQTETTDPLAGVSFADVGLDERDVLLLTENGITTPSAALAHEDLSSLPKIGKVTRDRVLKAIRAYAPAV